jgi:hypothetical protein
MLKAVCWISQSQPLVMRTVIFLGCATLWTDNTAPIRISECTLNLMLLESGSLLALKQGTFLCTTHLQHHLEPARQSNGLLQRAMPSANNTQIQTQVLILQMKIADWF